MVLPEMTQTRETGQWISGLVSRVTAEHIAYLAIAVLAAVLRFSDPGRAPLSPAEAGQALPVWQLWQPGSATVAPGSPAYFTMSALLSQVAGFSDGVMRLVPAIFGFALILAPWFLRHRLGRLGALVASLLLAISPLQTLTARTAGGQSIALFAGMLVFISWLRYQEGGRRAWLVTLAAALALGLTSAPLFYAISLSVALAWMAQRLIGPALILDEEGQRATLIKPSGREWRQALIIGLMTMMLAATAFFLALRGAGATADLLAEWLGRFQFTSSSYVMTGPFAALLRYEVGLLLIGLPAAVWAVTRDRPFAAFLVYWSLGVLLLILLQPGTMPNVLVLALPGYLLVGRLTNDIFERASSRWWWAFGLAVLFCGGVFYLNLVRYARLAGLQGVPDPLYHLLIAFLAVIVVLAMTLLIFGWDQAATTKGLLSGFLALLLLFTWGSAWWLSREAANDTRERWISSGTDADIRLLRETLQELSWQASNSAEGVGLTSAIDTPALRWYLRDFGNAVFDSSLPPSTASPVLITPLEYDPAVGSNYVGSEYTFAHPDTVHNLGRIDALRWWFFRQSPIPISEQSLVLWLRADIAEAG
jgi:hypothetical protein